LNASRLQRGRTGCLSTTASRTTCSESPDQSPRQAYQDTQYRRSPVARRAKSKLQVRPSTRIALPCGPSNLPAAEKMTSLRDGTAVVSASVTASPSDPDSASRGHLTASPARVSPCPSLARELFGMKRSLNFRPCSEAHACNRAPPLLCAGCFLRFRAYMETAKISTAHHRRGNSIRCKRISLRRCPKRR
jgi:hypothetical protein